jgi:glycosyltransferase involved in cell wall biosynthesis
MKILLVITKSEIGGAQVFVLNLARSLKLLGHEVEVAAGEGDYLFNELKKYDIPHHYLNSLKRDVSIFNSFYFIYDFYRFLITKDFQLIHLNSSNTLVGSLSAKLLKQKPKVVFTFHGLSFLDKHFNKNWFIKYFAKLYFKLFMKIVDASVFVSRLNFDESKQAGIVKYGNVILNGLDESQMKYLQPEEARRYFSGLCGIDCKNNFVIGSTGRLAYQKNYEFFIENFEKIKNRIPNAKIVIIGDGPDHDKFKKRIEQLGIQNDFYLVGAIKDSYQYIKAFDVFALPSRYEGLSISLIEAIFAGCPILASDVGGNSEIVDKNSPQLFELDNIDDFIGKLIIIKDNRERFINENLQLKEKFALKIMVDKYQKLYSGLVHNNKN